MSGQYDYLACEGNCEGVLEKGLDKVFPASKNRVTYVHPNAGHAINLAVSFPFTFVSVDVWANAN